MDIPQDKYRRYISQYRPLLLSSLTESPLFPPSELPPLRNLLYIVKRSQLSNSLNSINNTLHQQMCQEIKSKLQDPAIEVRMLALRLASCLQLQNKIQLLLTTEGPLTTVLMSKEYSFEITVDGSEFLLSIYQTTAHCWDIYLDVNTRVVSLLGRMLENCMKDNIRVGCELLRKIQCQILTTHKAAVGTTHLHSSLINRINNFLSPCIHNIILRLRQFQMRSRPRLYYGLCCATTHIPAQPDITELLLKELFTIIENINECDVNLQSYGCIKALLKGRMQFYRRGEVMKRWFMAMTEVIYKKEYVEYYVFILRHAWDRSLEISAKLKYDISVYCIELTKNIQQQYTRLTILLLAARNLTQVALLAYRQNSSCSLLIDLFQFQWFIARINNETDLLNSQLAISLLHCFLYQQCTDPQMVIPQNYLFDFIGLCNRLIDWKCSSKDESNLPTIKLSFELYLLFLSKHTLPQSTIVELIERCNQPSIYFLFRLQLVTFLLQLKLILIASPMKSIILNRLNLDFVEGEIRPFMMPKQFKPIFDFQYAQTKDGEMQSRKQIQCIKIMKGLLQILPQEYNTFVESIMVQYYEYLNQVGGVGCNVQLIECLQTLEADYYLTNAQRNYLLGLIGCVGSNASGGEEMNIPQLSLEGELLFSPLEQIVGEEVTLLGSQSPTQLTVTIHPSSDYSVVYLEVKKHSWVNLPEDLRFSVSSPLDSKELPYEDTVLPIRLDRGGVLWFQVWSTANTARKLLLASQKYKIKRRVIWRCIPHLKVINGVRTKAFLKGQDRCYVGYYFAEPLLVQLIPTKNQVVIAVPNKQIWSDMSQVFKHIVEQLIQGKATVVL